MRTRWSSPREPLHVLAADIVTQIQHAGQDAALLARQTPKSGVRLRVTPSPTFQREPMVVAPGLPGRRNGSRSMTLLPLTSPRQYDMLARLRHGSRWRTLKSGVRLRVTSTLSPQQRPWRLAGPQRGRALRQSGSAQAAVNRLSLRSGLGHRTVAAVACRRPLSGDLSDTSCTPSEENASATSRCYAIKGTLLQPSCVHARHCASSGGAMRGHNGR